jgi:hypothetical protein
VAADRAAFSTVQRGRGSIAHLKISAKEVADVNLPRWPFEAWSAGGAKREPVLLRWGKRFGDRREYLFCVGFNVVDDSLYLGSDLALVLANGSSIRVPPQSKRNKAIRITRECANTRPLLVETYWD